MATNRSLDSLVEAANMIEKSKGERDSYSGGEGSSIKELSGDCDFSRSLSSRMNHNVLERNRRAQMRQNFNSLQKMLPKLTGQKKVSNVCILKAATNEIQKLLDEDTTYRKEKEKLRESNMTLISKLKKLQHSPKASNLDQTDDKTGKESLITVTHSAYGSALNHGGPKGMGKSEVGVNTDFAHDSDDIFLQSPDDVQIEIEDEF